MSQHVEFLLLCESMTANDITAAVGLVPDNSSEHRGPGARYSAWAIRDDTKGVDLGQQLEGVLFRLRPHASRVRALVDSDDVSTPILSIVREFYDMESETFIQRLLGWSLERDEMCLLASMHPSGGEVPQPTITTMAARSSAPSCWSARHAIA